MKRQLILWCIIDYIPPHEKRGPCKYLINLEMVDNSLILNYSVHKAASSQYLKLKADLNRAGKSITDFSAYESILRLSSLYGSSK